MDVASLENQKIIDKECSNKKIHVDYVKKYLLNDILKFMYAYSNYAIKI